MKKKPIKSVKVTEDIYFRDFKPWSGAVDTFNRIIDEDKDEEMDMILDELYPEGLTKTELNDLLWFEPDYVYELLGMSSEIESGCHGKSKKDKNKKPVKSGRFIKSAEDGGWVVEDWDANEAYNFASEYFGKENLDEQIVQSLGTDELAACLAYIFRMNDFCEWDDYKNGNEIESAHHDKFKNKKKPVKSSSNKCWYGIPGIYKIWHGEYSDPELEYNGIIKNYYDVEDTMVAWARDAGVDTDDENEFGKYLREHSDEVYELFSND